MVDTSLNVYLSKPIGYATPRVSTKVNSGLWVMMLCQWRFDNSHKCTIWWGKLMVGEAVHAWDRGTPESVLSAQFCCVPKIALNNKIY